LVVQESFFLHSCCAAQPCALRPRITHQLLIFCGPSQDRHAAPVQSRATYL
jgi:hypothetical protein